MTAAITLTPFTDATVWSAFWGKPTDITTLLPSELETWPVVKMAQPHGDQVAVLTGQNPNLNELAVDAAVTNIPELILSVRVADCLPIMLYHPSGIVGVVHAGRRSTEQQLLAKTLSAAIKTWQVTTNWQIWFGPAICETCYQINPKSDQHYNLIAENLKQLDGILPTTGYSLNVTEHCTAHQPALFHSYRREGVGVPMNWGAIGLKAQSLD